MGKKITFKLVLTYLVAAVCMFALLNIFGTEKLEQDIIKNKKVVLYDEACEIADEYGEKYYESSMTLDNISQQLNAIDTFLDVRIWLLNSQGSVYLDTRNTAAYQRINVLSYSESFLDSQFAENIIIPDLFSEPMLVVTEPIYYDYSISGYVCILVTMESLRTETVYYIDFINRAYLIFLLLLFVLFVWLYKETVLPAVYLKKAAIEYARGNFEYKTKAKLHDEYKEIDAAILCIADELENLEEYQRKFVANVSHDLRSPLTSIKGYVEAIKDGTIPYEAQDRYMDIILFETERLTKLTSNLLTLNNLDYNKAFLDISVFDINNVIKTTAASFEGVCTKKKITLELIFTDENSYVEADFSKIQQVLYNLIDNAIKFSNPESSILVSTEDKGSKTFVSVKDFGIGIPKDSVKKIWERFYKTDISRGKDKKGTGLGLSIVKEIISAHKENINVISTEGVGTEFIFTLQSVRMD